MLNRGNVYAALAALSLAGYPFIAATSAVLGVGSTVPSFAMRSLIIVVSLILIFSGKYKSSAVNWVYFALFSFWFLYGLRIYYDTASDHIELSKPTFEYWIWAFGACFIPSFGLLTLQSKKYLDESINYSFFLLFFASIFSAIAGGTTVDNLSETYDSGRFRLDSLNPISLGHLGVSLMLIASWRYMKNGRIFFFGGRNLLFISSIFLGFYLMLASASRGPLVAFLIIGVVYIFSTKGVKSLVSITIFSALIFLFYQVASMMGEVGGFNTIGRVMDALSGDDLNVSIRGVAFYGAWHQFLESPFFGASLEENITKMNPHNIVIEAFMSTGFLGGSLLMIILIFALFAAIKFLNKKESFGWVVLIFLQYLIASQFSGAIYNTATFWSFLAIVIALCALKSRVKNKNISIAYA